MALWHKNTVFPDLFDHYCLMSINYFLRNVARGSQNQTFTWRQWDQYFLFLFFTQHLFQSFWSLLFDVNQLLSQKWRSKLSKANFCSKTVGTVFAAFCLLSINYFLRNGARNSQKRTFALRQWVQYLLFLLFTQHLFKSIWT